MTKREKGLRSWRARIKPPAMGAISGIPLLKRPGRRIPDAVSTLIRNKIKRKLREVNEINNIKENTKYYAEMEDRWDATLSEIQGERLDKEELTWEEWATLSRSILRDNFFDSEKRDYEITKRFQGIIDSETAWYKEHLRKTRKHKRDRAWQRLSQDAEKKTKKLKEVWENVKDSHNAEQ